MRLGKKKEKESDSKCQVVEGICRLVCSYKATQSPIKGLFSNVSCTLFSYILIIIILFSEYWWRRIIWSQVFPVDHPVADANQVFPTSYILNARIICSQQFCFWQFQQLQNAKVIDSKITRIL